tara:strand:+ start:8240 stop:8992 length:753 start_codon:yes stop_codon:yes gene_type:complete
MAVPTTRATFKDYIKRKLGHPVIEINLDDDQIEDRIDDALRFWQDYHFDGTEKLFVSHAVTQTDIDVKYLDLGDTLDNSIIGISRMLSSSGQSTNMFSVRYQMAFNDVATYSTRGVREMSNYWMRMSHLNMIQDLLSGMSNLRFNRVTNKVYIDWDWAADVALGDHIVLETYQKVGDTAELWGDAFLKDYATALVKEQWGMNLSKFEGVQLPGGVTLNGRAILEDARTEIERLKEQMSLSYELPVDFLVG